MQGIIRHAGAQPHSIVDDGSVLLMANDFGNPDTKTFERQSLRFAVYGETKIQVHKLIWVLVERILVGLDQAGIPVDGVQTTDDPHRLGFKLVAENADLVRELIAPAKFTYADGVVAFVGTSIDATTLSAALGQVEEVVAAEEVAEVAHDPKESVPGPFAREPEGLTLTFLQYLTGAEPTGEWDEGTESALRAWQQRNSVGVTGELDADTWLVIIPRRVGWLRPGATGLQVKVLQAAFKAHGYQNGPVTGIWGVEMSHTLRNFQADYGIPARLRIGNPEWDALFGARS